MRFFSSFLKSRWNLFFLGIVGVFVVWVLFRSNEDELGKYRFVEVERADVEQRVSVVGQVKPVLERDLAFEWAGRVYSVDISVGDRVESGDVLVVLENSTLEAELLEARAHLMSEEARLREVRRGTRAEEIDLQISVVRKAKVAFSDAQNNLIDVIRSAYISADYAVRDQVDVLFENARTSYPRLIFNASDFQRRVDVGQDRVEVGKILKRWNSGLARLSGRSDLVGAATFAKANMLRVQSFLEKLSFLVTSLSPNSGISQSDIDVWKTDIAAARSEVSASLSALSVAEASMNTAEGAWRIDRDSLALARAGSTVEEIEIYEAGVVSAQARVKRIDAQLEKTVLRAPFDGIITRQDADSGVTVALETSLVGIMGFDRRIEANVSEVDIAKIEVGDLVDISFDAFEDQVFEGRVSFIDPAEIMVQGVVYYHTEVEFVLDQIPKNVRPGMTADLDIFTDDKSDVLVIPQRAVFSRNGDRFVKILEVGEKGGSSVVEVNVKTGLRGSDGGIEVLSGISVGDNVIISGG